MKCCGCDTRLRNPSVNVDEGSVLVDVEEADVGVGPLGDGGTPGTRLDERYDGALKCD
jgi:hypothetical protein